MLWITALEGLPSLMTHCHETSVQASPYFLQKSMQFSHIMLFWEKVNKCLVKRQTRSFISLLHDFTKQIPVVYASADTEPGRAQVQSVWAQKLRSGGLTPSWIHVSHQQLSHAVTRQLFSLQRLAPAASTSGAIECNSLCM